MSLSSDSAVLTMPVQPANNSYNNGCNGWGGDWMGWIVLGLQLPHFAVPEGRGLCICLLVAVPAIFAHFLEMHSIPSFIDILEGVPHPRDARMFSVVLVQCDDRFG